MSPDRVAAALRARDTKLQPRRPDFGTDSLAALGIRRLHDDFVAIVRCFDGFADMDAGTISMWNVATILAEQEGCPPGLLAFGDVLIFSDIILCDPCDPRRPVVYRYEGRELAPTYAAFKERMVDGAFDLPGGEAR